jgi:hypothetical protein
MSNDRPAPTNAELANSLRSAVRAAGGEFVSISRLVALLIVERLDGEGPTHREPVDRRGRHNKKTGPELGKKTDLEDWDLIFDVWVSRERFEKNNDPAPTERAYGEIAAERGIQATSVKRAFERARKRTGAGTGRRP